MTVKTGKKLAADPANDYIAAVNEIARLLGQRDKLVEALRLVLKMRMYQPVGCAQFQRHLREAVVEAERVLREVGE